MSKKLHLGFYLSPDGKHIIELVQNNRNKYLIDVIGFDGYFVDFFFDLFTPEAMVIFSAWGRLT